MTLETTRASCPTTRRSPASAAAMASRLASLATTVDRTSSGSNAAMRSRAPRASERLPEISVAKGRSYPHADRELRLIASGEVVSEGAPRGMGSVPWPRDVAAPKCDSSRGGPHL